MTDEQTPGQRLDALIAELRAEVDELRTAVDAKAAKVSDAIRDKVADVSAKIDEIQAEWVHDEDETG